MRRNRPARQDKGNKEIVAAWRQVGASVLRIDPAGDRHQKGAPDYLVGFRGSDYRIELKRPGETLRPEQAAWHRVWKGRKVQTVDNVRDAWRAIGFYAPSTKAARSTALAIRKTSDDFERRNHCRGVIREDPAGDAWADAWTESPPPKNPRAI